MSASDLKVIGYYVDKPTAEITRMALEASGLDAIFQKDDGSGMPLSTGIQIVVRSEDYDKAEAILSQSESGQEGNNIDNKKFAAFESLFNEGVKLYEQRQFNEAEIKLKEALEIVPSSEDILYNLALIYLEQKKYDLVWETIGKIEKIDCQEIIDELEKAGSKALTFENYCLHCIRYDADRGVCKEIHENVREYPNKFVKECAGKLFKKPE